MFFIIGVLRFDLNCKSLPVFTIFLILIKKCSNLTCILSIIQHKKGGERLAGTGGGGS